MAADDAGRRSVIRAGVDIACAGFWPDLGGHRFLPGKPFFITCLSFSGLLVFCSCKSSLGDTGLLIPEEFWVLNLEPDLLKSPCLKFPLGLLGFLALLELPDLFNELGLP